MSSTFQFAGPDRFMHQKRGLQLLIRTKGVGALLFDPGLGKTAVVLDYAGLLALKAISGEARVLVVCPLAAVDTWVLQAETFGTPMVDWWAESLGGGLRRRAEALASRGGHPYAKPLTPERPRAHAARALHWEQAWAFWSNQDVLQAAGPDVLSRPRVLLEVVNLDSFSSRRQVGRSSTMADIMLDAVKRFDPDLLVIDESHRIKSAMGNASRLLGRIGKNVRRRVILTGTVMPHSPLDVYGQWRFLEPTAFGELMRDGTRKPATLGGFRARYAIQGGWMGKQVIGFQNLDKMQAIMARNSVVARKADALDLPPTTEIVIPVTLTPAEKRAYEEMKGQLAVQLASGQLATVPNRLAQMMRLRQITAGHLPDDSGTVNVVGDSKAKTISSLVHDTLAGETRIVVFALFTIEIDALTAALAREGTEVMVIRGSTSQEDRRLIRKRFGSDESTRMVLVAQVRTMSLAVNELITANHAIFASLSQMRDDFEQAKARLDRQGQTKPVTFWLALAPKTVDDVIYKSHRDRSDLETAVLQHIQGNG